MDGKLYGQQIKVSLLVDGYTAPITAGNFVDLVNKGFYNGMHVQVTPPIVIARYGYAYTAYPWASLDMALARRPYAHARACSARTAS